MAPGVKIFTGTNSAYLATEIATYYGQPLGKLTIQRFSDGEYQPCINESVRGDYIFFIQSTNAPADNLIELLLMVDAAQRASAGYITVVIPYFGLARQDRKDKPRVAIGAKLVANLLKAAGVNRLVTMDLHADQIQGFFDFPVDHLTSTAIFFPYIEHIQNENLIFASPDVGGTKRARAYAKYFKTEMVICDKQRIKANEVESMTLIGNVKGKDVVLVDDIVDTANTLCKAANLLIEEGAKSVRAMCTHPILSGSAYENIENSKLSELIVCDTIPMKKDIKKIKALSVASLFATAIRNTHEHKSISSLFIENAI
jgi:ribose-phosphate pyrophosphokinase